MSSIWSPGRIVEPQDSVNAATPKVGGRAVFPREWDQNNASISCPSCSNPMSFIISSPLESAGLARQSNTESIFYVFGCIEEECCGKKGSWRVFRWTDALRTPQEEEDAEPLKQEDIVAEVEHTRHADAWGLDFGNDDTQQSGAFDFGDLQEQLKTATAGISSGIKKSRKDACQVTHDRSDAAIEQRAVHKFDGYFPEFFLVQSGAVKGVQNRDSLGHEDSSSDEEQLSTEHENSAYRSPSYKSHEEEEEDGNAAWEGEAYEPDNVICGAGRTAPDDKMLKYMKHISTIPDQCLRILYIPSKSWHIASDEGFQAHGCSLCNAPRTCVAQVMSPLIAAVIESLDMVPAADHLRSPPSSWEWAILEIYVCSKLCTSRDDQGNAVLIEEAINIVGEA